MDVAKWLPNVNSCILEEDHLCQCFDNTKLASLGPNLQELKESNFETIQKRVVRIHCVKFNCVKHLRNLAEKMYSNAFTLKKKV